MNINGPITSIDPKPTPRQRSKEEDEQWEREKSERPTDRHPLDLINDIARSLGS